ncbi:MAG: hypothetical protein PUC73_05460 [Lachnospiraceae bacterium]|nr:hypothetical protein [Lachnospiraceae bacterium]
MAKGFIGHAVASENSNKYGNPGDQTGREVRYDDWYDDGWNVVLRPKSSDVAEKIAKAMEQAVENEAIGYCQSDRTTLYTQAEKRNWQIHLITTKCECDCSSLVAVCVNAAGIKVSKDIYTGNMVKALEATGAFEKKFTDKKHLKENSYLKRGDILIHEGSHTAIVLTDGDKVEKPNYEVVDFYGTVTAFWLNVRSEASTKGKIVKTIKKNSLVHVTRKSYGWGYIEAYNGWVSLSHIKIKEYNSSTFSSYVASTTTTVNFRTAPNSNINNNIITTFSKGQTLLIIKSNGDGWVYGKTTVNGQVVNGWIFNEYLQKIDYKSLQKRVVTDATGLNIRDKGNVKASKLCTIPYNKEFYVIKDDVWGVVIYNDFLGYSNLSKSYSERV